METQYPHGSRLDAKIWDNGLTISSKIMREGFLVRYFIRARFELSFSDE
jgi:hypothetical protein